MEVLGYAVRHGTAFVSKRPGAGRHSRDEMADSVPIRLLGL